MNKADSFKLCEQQVIRVLRKQRQIRTYLALSMAVFPKGIQGVEQSRALDQSIANLIMRGIVKRTKDPHGIFVYSLLSGSKGK